MVPEERAAVRNWTRRYPVDHTGRPRCRKARSRGPSLLAVQRGVLRVDPAGVRVVAAVHVVVPGHVVARLQDVIAPFASQRGLGRAACAEAVVALAAREVVALVVSLQAVIVGLPL